MCKFQLSKYLKAKDHLTIETGMELLRENVVLSDIAKDITDNLNTQPNIKAFLKMQGEIIEILKTQLQTYAFKA